MGRIIRVAVAVLLAGLSLAVIARPAAAAPTGRYLSKVFTDVDVTSDITYGGAVNDKGVFEVLKLDIYEPRGDTQALRPVFVWAHGGSMVFGDKADGTERSFANEFAKRGWVVLSINYRLMSRLPLEDCFHDLICALHPRLPLAIQDGQHDMQAAVRWARANAATYRLNPNEITAGGHSAGTALALRTNFAPNDPGTSGSAGYPSHISAAMTNSGAMLEPSVVRPNSPPIAMFNSLNDGDITFPVGFVNACLATTLMLNVCEFHGYSTGGHQLTIHRPEIFQKTSEFFCRRVLSDCDVTPADATGHHGPGGSHWATHVDCGPEPVTTAGGSVEVCLEDQLPPVKTRVFLTPDTISVDGDADNPLLGSSIHIPADPVAIVQAFLDVILGGVGSVVPISEV